MIHRWQSLFLHLLRQQHASRTKRRVSPRRQRTIRINNIPFPEGAYVQTMKHLGDINGINLEIRDVSWNATYMALLNDQIDIAIHNEESMKAQESSVPPRLIGDHVGHKGAVLMQSEEVFAYRDGYYKLELRRGGTFKKGKIAVVEASDLGGLAPHPTKYPVESVLECFDAMFNNSDVKGCIVGRLHRDFARSYLSKLVRISRWSRNRATLRFWALQHSEERDWKFREIMFLWNETSRIWKGGGRDLDELTDEILIDTNCGLGIGIIESFKDLRKLLRRGTRTMKKITRRLAPL